MANSKKLTKSPKANILVKMENSSELELQNGAEPSHLAETYASHGALKKAKARAVWTPPRMSTNKPLTRGKTVPLSPSKRDKRSQNQPHLTTPQRRSQGTSSRMMTPPNQLFYMLPNNSQTVKPKSKGRPPLSRTVIFPPSVSLHPIPVKAPPIVSPLQPLSVIGRRLLKNQCGECGRVLSSAAALESHVSLHTGRRPFSCTLCGKSFPDSKGLTRHGRVHRNGRIHVCSKCGKGFVYRFGLTKHLQMVHGRVKPFICQICDKGFFTKRDVEAHIRVHTGEKPFHCNLCEKQFKRRVELNVHLRWHNGEKRHWCPYCGKDNNLCVLHVSQGSLKVRSH
uniref:C2H2-type domain-containing protein n=1 Tax=Myripristis murdjan TaxID=586833 RepID=A0A667WX09_9TELE